MKNSPRRILLIQDRRMGDVVLTSALLDDLAAAYPAAKLEFLVGAPAAPLLKHHPLIHELIILDKERVAGLWREIRSRRYDLVVDVQGNLRTALVARASQAPVRVGWKSFGRSWMYTHAVRRELERQYVVRDRQRLLQAVGIPTAAVLPRLHLTDEERAAGVATLTALGVDANGITLGLILSSRAKERNWPVSHFVKLTNELDRIGITTVLLPEGEEDVRTAQFLRQGGRARVAPNVKIRPLMGLIAACSVLVSPDTGPAHIATALGVPRVTLYGPATTPHGWSPGLDTTVAVRSRSGSLAELQPDVVLRAILDMIARLPGRTTGGSASGSAD